ncbi:MAG: PAS domain S-box protein [Candidatus Cloacimonetes bacterium]|nr:PAS domain S-box protein [Candidatus Cloacimonadota bacterium]
MDVTALLQSLDKICISSPELSLQTADIRQIIDKLSSEISKLEQERDQFHSYIANANDTIAILDLDGKVSYTNENWNKQLGIDPQEVLHDRIFERYMHPEDAPKAQEFFELAIKTRQSQSGFQYRIKHKDGSWRWHMASISPIMNKDGEVESILSIARSIHDQKTAELKMCESERRMRLIFDTMREGVIVVDNNDQIQFVNKSLCTLFGIQAQDVLGKTGYEELIIPEDHHIIIEKNQQRTSGLVDEYQVRGRKRNGELIWLQISGAPIHDEQNQVVGSVGIMTDITQKHKMLQALHKSEEKYRHLFEDSLAGVFQSSFNDQYLNVNTSFAKMFGFESAQDMIAKVKDIKDMYVHPEQRENLKAQLLRDGLVEHYELELKRVDGSEFWVSLYARLGTHEDDSMILEGACVDITESKSLKEQLLASQKMEAIGKLAGGIAHDFNNLLTVILGYAEDIMENLNPNSQLNEPADEIIKAGLRAANLTRQLLAFSQKQILNNQEVNFNSLINNLHGIISRLTGEEIQVDIKLSEDLASVKADPSQIEQVLINMIINAKEAMPTGGRLIIKTSNQDVDSNYAELHPSLKEGKYVLLSISDTGCGIDRESINHLFEPFFTTKDKSRSSGLGLASAYGIIEQAGGAILPYSEPGKGTTMKILLPELRSTGENAAEILTPVNFHGQGQKILVVEDEEALGRIVQKMLLSMGYNVTSSGSSLHALKILEEGEHFDLIITDVVMPAMNGKELANAIHTRFPEQKILFMSGFADDVIAQHGILDPNLPFIQKPFSAKTIAPVIHKLLSDTSNSYKLMILDDEEGICKLFQRSSTKRGHHCDAANTISEAIGLLSQNNYDMLLIDMNLKAISGPEAIRKIRDIGCKTPIIVLSGIIQSSYLEQLKDLNIVKIFEKGFDNTPILKFIENYLKR